MTAPASLAEQSRWLLWRQESRDGKLTKVPYQAHSPTAKAAVDNPSTWADCETARAALQASGCNGLGFVLGQGIVGLDLDHVCDAPTGHIQPWAWQVIKRLDSYTEYSPSGTGVHVLTRGSIPAGLNRVGPIELYADGRFFTITGKHLYNSPPDLQERTAELAALHGDLVLLKEFSDWGKRVNAEKVAALLAGKADGYPSGSERDLAFASYLIRWAGGDTERADRVFRLTGCYREKWERADYRERTFAKALESVPPAAQPESHPATLVSEPQPAEQPAESDTPPLAVPLADFMANPPPPTPPLVGSLDTGVIWYAARIGFIAGPPKEFKTMTALDMTVSVAGGQPFLSRFPVPASGPVLVVQQEITDRELWERLDGLLHRRNLQPDIPIHLASNRGLDLDTSESQAWLRSEVERVRPVLLVLDPLAELFLGDENDSQAMRRLIRYLKALRNEFGCAILVVHHYRKAGGIGAATQGGQMMRGSSVLHGASECALYVKRRRGTKRVTITVELRGKGEPEPFVAALHDDAAGAVLVFDGNAEREAAQEHAEIVFDAIADLGDEATVAGLASQTGLSEDLTRKALARLKLDDRALPERIPGMRGRQVWRVAEDDLRLEKQLFQPRADSEGM